MDTCLASVFWRYKDKKYSPGVSEESEMVVGIFDSECFVEQCFLTTYPGRIVVQVKILNSKIK